MMVAADWIPKSTETFFSCLFNREELHPETKTLTQTTPNDIIWGYHKSSFKTGQVKHLTSSNKHAFYFLKKSLQGGAPQNKQ